MGSGPGSPDPAVVAAFRSALMHQGLTALLVLAALAICWATLREWRPDLARRAHLARLARQGPSGEVEVPAARRLIRLGFGLLWTLDGLLQAQPALVAGTGSKIIAPAAATSPGWVRHLAGWAAAAWSGHPVQANAAAVWIQVGIGIWMLAAAHGRWSRLAGLAGAAWGLAIWVFGEAFGGILAPGQTVLSGAPGAALFYCAAGALLALPDRSWRSAVLGRRLLAGMGTFLVAMAVLQAWPGRGFWQGTAHGKRGTLTAMVAEMSGTPQPQALARLVGGFASLPAGHGFGVNALAVAALAGIGIGLASRRRALLLPVTVAAAVLCLADWVLVQDLGFLGGLGTDPNSMIPLLLLIACGYLAVTRTGSPEPAGSAVAAAELPSERAAAGQPAAAPPWRDRLAAERLAAGFASVSAQGILAAWASALVLLGAASMALAQVSAPSSAVQAGQSARAAWAAAHPPAPGRAPY